MFILHHFLSDDETVEKEAQAAAMLASVLLQHSRGRIDAAIPQILQIVVKRLLSCETTALKILLTNNVRQILKYFSY